MLCNILMTIICFFSGCFGALLPHGRLISSRHLQLTLTMPWQWLSQSKHCDDIRPSKNVKFLPHKHICSQDRVYYDADERHRTCPPCIHVQ
jgi:hypothetical protein